MKTRSGKNNGQRRRTKWHLINVLVNNFTIGEIGNSFDSYILQWNGWFLQLKAMQLGLNTHSSLKLPTVIPWASHTQIPSITHFIRMGKTRGRWVSIQFLHIYYYHLKYPPFTSGYTVSSRAVTWHEPQLLNLKDTILLTTIKNTVKRLFFFYCIKPFSQTLSNEPPANHLQ